MSPLSLNGLDTIGQVYGGRFRLTPEGGLAVLLINGTGGNTVKGYLVSNSSATANAVVVAAADEPDVIGVFYNDGVANGQLAWVVVNGIADVYFNGNATLGHFARNQVAADSGTAGRAISESMPTAPFATDKHFHEIGHVLEARTGAGLAKCALHFN